jgi:DNA-binding response OmpR family regulator
MARILVVEDENLLAMQITWLLEDAGHSVVGPEKSVDATIKVLARQKVDLALLDVKLGAETVFPISKLLDSLHVPYIFVTGEGGSVPDEYRHRPLIAKPYEAKVLVWQIKQLLADAESRYGQAEG